jgi:hypothetical protein
MKGIIFIMMIMTTQWAFANTRLNNTSSRESREVNTAESDILWSLMIPINKVRPENADEMAELALTLIGARSSKTSLISLTSLLRFQLDGGLGEDYNCYAAEKGKRLLPYLKRVDPEKLEAQCLGEIQKIMQYSPNKYSEESKSECRTQAQIKEQVKELIQVTYAGHCDPKDF